MALQKEVVILFRPRDDDQVRFSNVDPEFPPRSFTLSPEIPKDGPGDWGNYLKAPCQALAGKLGHLRGFDALLTSTLPVASGLSSSSALVVAAARALLHANRIDIPVLELAEEMAAAERYTGTQGGGMDQAISLGAVEGHASRIEFDPLRLFETAVPPGWRFIVAHTLVRAEKSGGAQSAYNRRREECAEALAQMWEVHVAKRSDSRTPTYSEIISSLPLEELLALAGQRLPATLLQRFRHVVTEAERVYEAEDAMGRGDLLTFGLLMDASHESLRGDYEVSSPALDQLVTLAREGGAAGARLTGAGFGGCMVALADESHADRVLNSLEEAYYRDRGLGTALGQALFRVEPSGGASVEEF
jgi:galactokinase